MHRPSFLLLAVIVTAACSSSVVVDPADRASPANDKEPLPLVELCLPDGGDCTDGGVPCCAGSFCADPGYGVGLCSPTLPDGAYCTGGDDCSSGVCWGDVCVSEAPACRALGEVCADLSGDFAPCCEGACVGPVYGTAYCQLPEPDGGVCSDALGCESQICSEGVCRSATCAGDDAQCNGDASCCAGFCSASELSYGPGTCLSWEDKGAQGAYCETFLWCLSGSCVDFACE